MQVGGQGICAAYPERPRNAISVARLHARLHARPHPTLRCSILLHDSLANLLIACHCYIPASIARHERTAPPPLISSPTGATYCSPPFPKSTRKKTKEVGKGRQMGGGRVINGHVLHCNWIRNFRSKGYELRTVGKAQLKYPAQR